VKTVQVFVPTPPRESLNLTTVPNLTPLCSIRFRGLFGTEHVMDKDHKRLDRLNNLPFDTLPMALSELDEHNPKDSHYELGTTGEQARTCSAALPHLCLGSERLVFLRTFGKPRLLAGVDRIAHYGKRTMGPMTDKYHQTPPRFKGNARPMLRRLQQMPECCVFRRPEN